MATDPQGEPELPDSSDATVGLSPVLLLEALGQLRAAATREQLREHLAALLAQLDDPQSALLAPAPDQSATFSRSYLLGELAQIGAARSLERAHYYIERLARSIGQPRTSPVNDINLNRWKEYDEILTDSLWLIDRRDSSGAHTAGYWGNYIPQIPRQMMRRYTRPGEWVLDTFAGLGTTLIEGQRLGRNTLGIELQPTVAAEARRLIAQEPNDHGVVSQVACADSATVDYAALLEQHSQRSAQLVLMHPPYFDIIRFSDDPRDLSNAATVEGFLEMIGRVVENVAPLLDRGRYLALVIGDKYARGDWVPLGFRTMDEVLKRGFALKSIVVKNFDETLGKRQQKELWRYRALAGGFYVFKHEYLFLFRKQ